MIGGPVQKLKFLSNLPDFLVDSRAMALAVAFSASVGEGRKVYLLERLSYRWGDDENRWRQLKSLAVVDGKAPFIYLICVYFKPIWFTQAILLQFDDTQMEPLTPSRLPIQQIDVLLVGMA
jgi:hypothetical protein